MVTSYHTKCVRVQSRVLSASGILASVDTYEPMQPPSNLRTSKRCSFSSLTLIEYSSD